MNQFSRRRFLQAGLGAAAGSLVSPLEPRSLLAAEGLDPNSKLRAKADAVIMIWLPGGIAQTDTWDCKQFTPFEPGMKGSQLLGTCPTIPTTVDGLRIGGLDEMATVMHHGTVLRSLTSATKFGAVHLKAQY